MCAVTVFGDKCHFFVRAAAACLPGPRRCAKIGEKSFLKCCGGKTRRKEAARTGRLIDKCLLLVLCFLPYAASGWGAYLVVPVLGAVLFSAAGSLVPQGWPSACCTAAYSLACIPFAPLLSFYPLLCYDAVEAPGYPLAFAVLVPAALHMTSFSAAVWAQLGALTGLSVLLGVRAGEHETLRLEANSRSDDARESALLLQRKNRELLEKQDYETNLATLNERNRIARDIHDNVGHLLSRALLQTGALLATTRDTAVHSELATLRATLSDAMDAIRSSVHNLFDESVDLSLEVRRITEEFRFCPVRLENGVDSSPPREVKYAFLAVLREALSNVMRHSDATRVTVSLREHPALYQLIVRDNGTRLPKDVGGGIGLANIARRVETLGGFMRAGFENGFEVFVSVPKASGDGAAGGQRNPAQAGLYTEKAISANSAAQTIANDAGKSHTAGPDGRRNAAPESNETGAPKNGEGGA